MSEIRTRQEWLDLAVLALAELNDSAHDLTKQVTYLQFISEMRKIMDKIRRECNT